MSEYITTNIRLPKEVHRGLKRRALEEDKSLAEIVREAVVQYLTAPQGDQIARPAGMTSEEWENDPLWAIGSDAGPAGIEDGAVNHYRDLYGRRSDMQR